jgi:ribulose-bisphosphate carboxylase large chain
MHAAMTRDKDHGISMLVLAKLARMCGVDQLHIGAVFGKMEAKKDEVLDIHNSLNSAQGNHKAVFSVCSGGLSPLDIPDLIKTFGTQIVIQAGGGVHGHPKGTLAGAKAMVQATEAAMHGANLKSFAKDRSELKTALKKWE